MSSESQNPKSKSGISGVTVPLYKTLVVCLAIHYFITEPNDGKIGFLEGIISLCLGIIVIAQVVGIYSFFKNRNQNKGV